LGKDVAPEEIAEKAQNGHNANNHDNAPKNRYSRKHTGQPIKNIEIDSQEEEDDQYKID
jgi:hypothetical protein